jgi:hypothetical protein
MVAGGLVAEPVGQGGDHCFAVADAVSGDDGVCAGDGGELV